MSAEMVMLSAAAEMFVGAMLADTTILCPSRDVDAPVERCKGFIFCLPKFARGFCL